MSSHKRELTDGDLAEAARLLAEGKSVSAIGKALRISWGRARTITNQIAVLERAERLRMTEHVPAAIDLLTGTTTRLLTLAEELAKRMTALEGQMNKMNRTVRLKTLKVQKQAETIKSLREREKDLRAAMRRRGLALD